MEAMHKTLWLYGLVAAFGPTLFAQSVEYDFVRNGVQSAKVEVASGIPRLLINGQAVPPFLFFYNARSADRIQNLDPQLRLAAANGVHIYSFSHDSWPWDNPASPTPSYDASTRRIEQFLASNPRAVFLLRTGVWPGPNWAPPIAPSRDEDNQYADGSTEPVSLASDLYFQAFLSSFRKMVRFYENSSHGRRIIGYHVEAQNSGEWFPMLYRERGIDVSPANANAFRRWLATKYQNGDALTRAWGRTVSLSNAGLPRALTGRFPMRGTPEGARVEFFYRPGIDQDWIDYSEYISDLVADRILQVARIVKEETNGRKLTAFFHGYMFELPGSMNGHMKLERLLRSPDVDIIAAPNAYWDLKERNGGGAGAAMGAVDSVALHGKLWMNEDDLRTHIAGASPLQDLGYNGNLPTANLAETIGVLDRNIATNFFHRTGTWWMDLNAVGAFSDPALWELARTRALSLFDQLYAAPTPYVPDVALITDEASVFNERLDADIQLTRGLLQNSLRHSGASIGSYLLRDFLEGRLPAAKVYIFANIWRLTEEQARTIRSRLAAQRATAIWQLAPGYSDGTVSSAGNVSRVTGISLKQVDGFGGSTGTGLLSGSVWGWAWGQRRNVLSPRLVVDDPDAVVLGRYWADNEASTASKRTGGFQSVFVGDIGWNAEMLRPLLRAAGVHLWSENGDVVQADDRWLAFHSSAAGIRTLSVPSDTVVSTLAGQTVTLSIGQVTITSRQAGETSWFRLAKQPAGPTSNPPAVVPWIGVVNGASFGDGIAGGSWFTILGQNLSATTRIWNGDDFGGDRLPTQLDGVRVLVNGKSASVYYISPTQINALMPTEFQGQVVTILVANSSGMSIPTLFQSKRFAPALFTIDRDRRYPAAVFPDGVLAGPPNLLGAGVAMRAARPGEFLAIYGTGFGPTSPIAADGVLVQAPLRLSTALEITIGGVAVTADFAGLVGSGLYQINLRVPQLPAGDHDITLNVGGSRSQVGLKLTIGP